MASSSQSRQRAERLAEKRKRDSNDQDVAPPKRKRRQPLVAEEPETAAVTTAVNGALDLTAQEQEDSKARQNSLQSSKKKKPSRSTKRRDRQTWKLSEPMGGRMLDIDPIFTENEEYLLLTYNTSIQVYSTTDSLLDRRINIPVASSVASCHSHPYIISSVLSRVSPNLVWVLCSDGRVWRVDWTNGNGTDEYFQIRSQNAFGMTAIEVRLGNETRDVMLVSEKPSSGPSQIIAYDLTSPTGPTSLELQNYQGKLNLVKSAEKGRILVCTGSNTVIVGSLKSKDHQTLEDLQYSFFSFESSDDIACVSIRVHNSRKQQPKKKQMIEATGPVLDVAIGCARGAIYVYADLLARLQSIGVAGNSSVQPRKFHWHRRAVHSVAWSEDGNYLISGGSEATLVLWQIDTGRCDFLPHLSASVENIVVSPRGSSYAVHLDDNSTMVLSTAEMKPTAYVSGVQSLVFGDTKSKDYMVRRVWEPVEEISTPVPAVFSPKDPSQLLICVGNGQQASLSGAVPAIPMLQTFDLGSFQNVSKQPLTRSNAADNAFTANGYPVIEPRVTKLAFSGDGSWLATIDEWEPQPRDLGALADSASITKEDLCRERREIYLKFWTRSSDGISLELSTRINGPHFTRTAEEVFGLAADPLSAKFASIGNDGMVRIWSPKLRQRDGLAATGSSGETLSTWSCERFISIGESLKAQDELQPLDGKATYSRSGAIAFSEDGSIIFVAYGAYNEGVVYIIDAQSGEIRSTLHDMFKGAIRDIQPLDSCLIMLSDDLAVYDVVLDELRYGVHLSGVPGPVSHMTHLAVDAKSKRFAVAIPTLHRSNGKLRKGAMSDIAVFDLEYSNPEFTRIFPHLITSLLPAANSPGFIILDSAAQVTSVIEATSSALLAQPLADLHLNGDSTADLNGSSETALIVNGLDVDGSDDEEPDAMDTAEDDASDVVNTAVFPPQRLTEIFDAAPAFAMPPIEDLFYRVAGLFSAPSSTS